MNDDRISIYPSTKAYTRADGSVVRHVSNRKYVKKLPVISDEDCRAIASRQDNGERLSTIGAEYSMTYARTWAIMKRWREAQSGIVSESAPTVTEISAAIDPEASSANVSTNIATGESTPVEVQHPSENTIRGAPIHEVLS
jgi:hypothetical protein